MKSSPTPVEQILKNLLQELNVEQALQRYSVFELWGKIVGEKIAQKSVPLRLQGNFLIVGVSSHSWMTELTLLKQEILHKIHQEIANCPIQNLKFELRSSRSGESHV